MNLLIPNHCHKCGVIDEAYLSHAGPHVKQSCSHCGAYQKFINVVLIPDVREIKLRIFGILTIGGDEAYRQPALNLIKEYKKEIVFVENLIGIDAKLQYWKLYLRVLKKQEELAK